MKVDRERFLVLAAALTACGGTTDAQPAQQAQIPPQPPIAYEPLAVPPMASASASAAPPPAPPPVEQPVAHSGKVDLYAGTPVTGQTCDPAENKIGTPPACKISGFGGPTCESINDTKKECPTLTKLLKPRVAQAALECLNQRSGTKDICEFNVSSMCAYEALQHVCVEPTAAKICTPIVQRCGAGSKMAQSSCEAGVSAIAESKKKKFIACISEFCRFETCLTYL